MGIDLKQGGRGVNKSKKDSRSSNVYLRLLIKVRYFICSFTPFWPEELKLNSTKWCLKDSINLECKDTLSLFLDS